MKKFGILITVFLCSVFLYSTALAVPVPIDSYTLNFSGASQTLTNANVDDVNNVSELGFTQGQTFVGFNDTDGDGEISQGDTFDDYFAIAIKTITDTTGSDLHVNTGYAADHELTLVGNLSGIQTTDTTYSITSIDSLNFYFDAGDDFTQHDTSNLSTYADGTAVETGSLIAGGGSNQAGIISGTFDLILDVQDLLHTHADAAGEYFELDDNGDPFDMNLVLGLVDSNTDGSKTAQVGAFENYFNFNASDYNFYETAFNDGTINKAIVPEPATMLLFGTGLLGLAGLYRRRFRKS